MLNKHLGFFTLTLMALMLMYACRTQKVVAEGKPIRNFSTGKIIDSVEKYKLSFAQFASKISIDAEWPDNSETFKANLRIRKDSVTWVSISKAAIVVATSVITPDSVKALVKFSDAQGYYPRSFNFINDLFGTELDYQMLQDLLVGNPISFDADEKYKSPADSAYYMLSTHRKRQIKRATTHDKVPRKEPVIYRYWFYPATFKPAHITINDLNDTTTLDVRYLSYEMVDSVLVPDKAEVEATKGNKKVKLSLSYSRTKLNEKTDYPFNVPDDYEKK